MLLLGGGGPGGAGGGAAAPAAAAAPGAGGGGTVSRVGAARLRKGLLSFRGAGVLLVRRGGAGTADGAGPAAAAGLVPAAVAAAAGGAAVVILDASDAMAAMVADCRFGGPGRVADARRLLAPGALLQSIVQARRGLCLSVCLFV